MNLSDIRQADLAGKCILMRVDFNVLFEDGKPKQKYKIESVKETVDYILSKPKVKLALLSHLGRPESKDKAFSFAGLCQGIAEVLEKEIVFVEDCIGEAVKNGLEHLQEGQILILENVRFHKEDIGADMDFARQLADNFDVYINEAFGVSHRNHASTTKIAEILSSFAGLNLQKEVGELNKLRENFQKPALAIIGGAKIETKLPVIHFFADLYDYVLVGGKIGLEARAKNIHFPDNVVMPRDYQGEGLDIGPLTMRKFTDYIKQAKTIVWNGPLGRFEESKFNQGTIKIIRAITENESAYKIAGGGETIQILENNNLMKKFNFISTGGGSMLEFLVKGTLPALEALKKHAV